MKTTHYNNRTNVSFNLQAYGNDMVIMYNDVLAIANKHNAQVNLYSNRSHLKFDKNGNVIGSSYGSFGGAITFHNHSCNHEDASLELINYLKICGLTNEHYKEVVKTHRSDGTPYKMVQTFIEKK